jgi:peptide/nickel transport system permease protein
MRTFALRRLLTTAVMLFCVILTAFLLAHLTGDPVRLMVPEDATERQIVELRHELGLDRPLVILFVEYVTHALRGDLGPSIRYRKPTMALILERLPATVELSSAAMVIALVIAIPTGVISAVRPGSLLDAVTSTATIVGQALPPFWIGIMLIVLFAVQLGWVPAAGRGGFGHLVLPAITLSLFPMARLARVLRSSLLDVLQEDYIRTARAKGLAELRVLVRHGLRSACIPLLTVAGLTYGSILGGTVITESVFAWPGVGRLALEAVYNRDFPLVQAIVLVAASMFILINLFVDLAYGWLDPRIRLR